MSHGLFFFGRLISHNLKVDIGSIIRVGLTSNHLFSVWAIAHELSFCKA
jgi:hypothetical protein